MVFALDFAEDFFVGSYDLYFLPPPSETPTCVLQALTSMHPDDWEDYCRKVLRTEPRTDAATYKLALDHVRRVNSCFCVTSPVEVSAGDGWVLLVYDPANFI